MSSHPEPRRERWDRAAQWPLTFLALVFLAAYAWPILDPDLPDWAVRACATAALVVWAAFVVDYVARLLLSVHRWEFVRTHPLDLLVVLLPVLRPLRLLQLVRVLTVLNRSAGGTLRGQLVTYVSGATVILLLVAALAILDAERDAEGGVIEGFGDALWWAFATVTTVGYGDRYPVTTGGRYVAAGLMLVGIALLGVVTATFASWLIDRVTAAGEDDHAATRADIAELAEEVRRLRTEVAALAGGAASGGAAAAGTATGPVPPVTPGAAPVRRGRSGPGEDPPAG